MPLDDAPRQLILAAATGYTWAQIEPFVRSLRATGYRGDIVMLVGLLEAADRQALIQAGVQLWRVHPLPNKMPPERKNLIFNWRLRGLYRACRAVCDGLPLPMRWRRRIKARLGRGVHHIACSRYYYYYAYLDAHAKSYDEVMLTDVRDVIFQANPFSVPLQSPQRFFIEHRSLTVGGQINNAMWVAGAYGEAALARIAAQPVSCSGISYGTTAGILDYLAAMTDELTAHTHEIAGSDGYDQGVHNFLIWSGRFPRAQLAENSHGPVLTLQAVPAGEIRADATGRLLNDEGAVVPVLHQYDRHPGHCARLRAMLG
jgi:hypothetical protein